MNPVLQNVTEELLKQYQETDYCFSTPQYTFTIRIGEDNADFMNFLKQEGISQWAYLTAYNPFSLAMPAYYNQNQQQRLLEALKAYRVFGGAGQSRSCDWPAEESAFVAGIPAKEACRLGIAFGQNAILLPDEEGRPVLKQLQTHFLMDMKDGILSIIGWP